MTPEAQANGPRNKLLRALPAEALAQLRPHLSAVPLQAHRVLQHSRLPIKQVYFIESGLVSVEATTEEGGHPAEGWLVGREGLAGLPVVLGVEASPHRRVVQVEGEAWSIPAAELRRFFEESADLRNVLLRYVHSVLVESAQTSACNARHPLTGRLARVLLTMGDRLGADTIDLTHAAVARLLGVRRASITGGLRELEQSGGIELGRAQITIKDRQKLEALTCYCYSVLKANHQRDTG